MLFGLILSHLFRPVCPFQVSAGSRMLTPRGRAARGQSLPRDGAREIGIRLLSARIYRGP
jgi:hypothetical protein